MCHPEGARSDRVDRVDFDRRVQLAFRGAQISSDGGLLVMRALDDVLRLSNLASAALRDTRRGRKTIHRRALDPVMREVVGGRAVDAQAASASQMARALSENRQALADLNGQWIDRFHDRNGLKYIVLDMDSSVSPTHGDQKGPAV